MGCLVNNSVIKDAIGNSKFYKKLQSKFNDRQGSFDTCLLKVLTTNLKTIEDKLIPQVNWSNEFSKWYKRTYNLELPEVSNVINDSIINAILVYNNLNAKNGNDTRISKPSKANTNYIGGEYTRQEAIENAQGFVLDKYIQYVFKDNIDVSNKTRNDYENDIIRKFSAHLSKLLGLTSSDVQNIIKNNLNSVKEIFDNYKDIVSSEKAKILAQFRTFALVTEETYKNSLTDQAKNTIETIKEITNLNLDYDNKYINSNFFENVWNSRTLFGVIKTNTFDDEQESKAVNEEDNSNGFDLELTDDDVKEFDESIRVFENHSGINYSSFLLHINENIRLYLSSLPTCNSINSDGSVVEDTNTVLGIPKKLDGNYISTLLYSMTEKGSVDELLNSINNIAQTFPEFSALKLLHDNLIKDMDLAYNFYYNFGKYVMPRDKVTISENEITNKVSNIYSDRRSAFNFQLENDLKNTIISNNKDITEKEYNELNAKYNKDLSIKNKIKKASTDYLKSTDDEFSKYVDDIYNILKRYYPSISRNSIENYLKFNKEKNKIDIFTNISSLLNSINSLLSVINNSERRYLEYQNKRQIKVKENKNANEVGNKNVYDLSKDIFEPITEDDKKIAYSLANKLLPYSVVNVELTVSNVKGNNSSAVQNPNFLTRFMDMLNSTLNNTDYLNSPLKKFADDKLRGNSFKYSNILIERKNEKGIIINRGLFYKTDENTYKPTSYATSLLSIHLLDGVANNKTGNVMQWSDMKNPDGIITSIESYFNTEGDEKFTNYILKTPSDAPNQYFIHAPKYKIEGLFKINKDIIAKQVKNTLKNISTVEYNEDEINYKVSKYGRKISTDQLIDIINGKLKEINVPNLIAIPLSEKSKNKKEKNAKVLTVECITSNNKNPIRINLIGNMNIETRTFNISNFNVISEGTTIIELEKVITESIEFNGNKNNVEFNYNHPIFQQLYNMFCHEMQDAADAVNVIFSHNETGKIFVDENQNPIVNPDVIDELYPNYHYGKEGLVKTVNGFKQLTGRVFSSELFTLMDKNGNKVNYMDKVVGNNSPNGIFFLYGGFENHLHFNNKGELYFTKEQDDNIKEAISDFIYNYIINNKQSVDKYSELEHTTPFTYSTIGEWALNYLINYNNTSELFEGESKFYKDVAQTSKREKEIQGAGNSYALYNVNSVILSDNEDKKEVENSYLNSDEVQKQLGDFKVKQYDRFKAVTVKNVIRTSENSKGLKKTLNILHDELYGVISKENIGKEKTEQIISSILTGYGIDEKIKADDAQSYIIFDEWIRRVAAKGQLKKYMPLITKILDETQTISAEDINQFIQVQKNFYYDMHYDETFGKHMPRQIKNAEFVLIPRFIKGTQLETIYNIMKEAGIDQLNTEETTKAAKNKILQLWNEDGTVNTETFNKTTIMKATQAFSYNYLYEQQETPQHVNKENKAALQVVKKILDNINEDSPKKVIEAKEHFLKAFSQNIYDDFENLMIDLGVDFDENGNLKIGDNEVISGLEPNLILEKIEQEFTRIGSDSNLKDYTTPIDAISDFGITMKMPAILNSLRKKIENVSQSVFNNNITRQKLKGSHLVQITSVGFKTKHTKDKIIKDKDLRYHITEDGKYDYAIEVRVAPGVLGLNSKDFANEEDMLAYAINEGLHEFIGYRIPTEGKQSMAIMRVVGFLNDAQGSTIAVPDEWVAQTGSDMDIDSVYTINYETYKNKKGIHKIQPEYDYEKLYIKYLKDYLSYEDFKYIFDSSKLTKEEKEEISNTFKNENENITTEEIYNKLNEEERKLLLSSAEIVAASNNLDSFEKFSENKDNIYISNSKQARSNIMLESMMTILKDNSSLEENLSRSKFTSIITERDDLLKGTAIERKRKNKNSNSIIDQLDLHTTYSSGAVLKGISVMRDRLNSISNVSHGKLNTPIKIQYKLTNEEYKLAQKTFDKITKISEDNNHVNVIIEHDMWGWSLNNRNIVGEILTSYSSQTTAHNLDAVKEGDIPNVTSETFGVYKTFVDLGSDYRTAIAFMLQPIITELVETMDTTNSIYSTRKVNAINEVYRNIAKKFGLNSIGDINKIKNNIRDYIINNKLYNLTSPINREALVDRIHKTSSPVKEDIAMDYYILSKYEEIKRISDTVERNVRVLNPDKFGAKQTIFETNRTFEDIFDLIDTEDANILYVEKDGKRTSLLESIYPGINQENAYGTDEKINNFIQYKGNFNDSVYPPLYYFLKYATATSIKINSLLYPTQSPQFRNAVNTLGYAIDVKLSKQLNDKFESYLLKNIYQNIRLLSNPIAYNKNYGIQPVEIVDYTTDRQNELRRIFGYGHNSGTYMYKNGKNFKFEPENIDAPTDDELNQFAILFSPAQKVAWLQEHFKDSLVCNYLKAILYVGKYRENLQGSQLLEFNNDIYDKEILYNDFYNTFYNDNPFFVLTAIDIIKYSFVVEGFDISKRAINKVIDNDIIIDLGLRDEILDGIGNFINNRTIDNTEYIENSSSLYEIIENFIRSHSDIKEIPHILLNKSTKQIFDDNKISIVNKEGKNIASYVRKFDIYDDEDRDFILNNRLGQIVEDLLVPKNYAVIDNVLYKIEPFGGEEEGKGCYFYPLNKLQPNEVINTSANDFNNKYLEKEYYQEIIKAYEEDKLNQYIDVAKYTIDKTRKGVKMPAPITETDIKAYSNDYTKLIQEINDSVINKDRKSGYIWDPTNRLLTFKMPRIGNQSSININGKDYTIHRIYTNSISKYTKKSKWNSSIDKIDLQLADIIQSYRNLAKNLYNEGKFNDNSSVFINGVYKVVEVEQKSTTENNKEPEVLESSISERLIKADEHIVKIAYNSEDEDATQYIDTNRANRVASNKKSIEANELKVAMATARYVIDKVPKLIQDLNQFYIDEETGNYLTATDDKIFELIKDNQPLNRKLLKLILDCNSMINTFSTFENADYLENEKDVKLYIDKILNELNKLKRNIVYINAEKKYVELYLDKISNDPTVKQNLFSVIDSYHPTSGFMANVGDIQNSNNRIVQVTLNQILGDIRAKEFKGKKEADEFEKTVKEISSKGSVDWNKIIDEHGVFIRDYSEKFVDNYYALTANNEIASHVFTEINKEYNEYLQSENKDDNILNNLKYKRYLAYKDVEKNMLNYRRWLIKNTNQELNDVDLNKLLELDENMFNNFNSIYIEYKLLEVDRHNLLSSGNSELDENFYRRLNSIDSKISELTSNVILVGDEGFIDKPIYKKETTDYNTHINNIKSETSATALKNYLNNKRQVLSAIYDEKAKLGFEELLNKYLDVINRKEAIDANGIKKSLSELMNDKEYADAKHWLQRNARFEWGYKYDDRVYLDSKDNPSILPSDDILLDLYNKGKGSKYTKTDQIVAAMEFFKSSVGQSSNKNSFYKKLAKNKKAYDEYGVIDGTKFDDSEIKHIKKEQENRYNLSENRLISENNIMHNKPEQGIIVYNNAFWNHLKLGGQTTEEYKEVVKKINNILSKVYNLSTQKIETSRLTDDEIKFLLKEFEKFGYSGSFFDRDNATIKKKKGITRGRIKQYSKFVNENMEFVYDTKTFNIEKANAKKKGDKYFNLWCELNQEWDSKEGKFVPNHMIWGDSKLKMPKREDFDSYDEYKKAKEKLENLYVDKKRTAALRVIKESFTKTTTQYYEEKDSEMRKLSNEKGHKAGEPSLYEIWFDNNHIYDPNSGTIVPLPIWIKHQPNESIPGKWVPTYNMEDKFIKEDRINKNYVNDGGIFGNFKKKDQKEKDIKEFEEKQEQELNFETTNIDKFYPDNDYYNNKINTLNSTELELKDYVENKLLSLVTTKKAKKFLYRGYAPNRAKINKDNIGTFVVKEFAKAAGWIEGNQGNDRWEPTVSYEDDYVPDMPMLNLLKKSAEEDLEPISRPVRENDEDIETYKQRYEQYIKDRRARKELERKAHDELIDRNWENVISEFIKRASHFNAVQENKYQFYFAQTLLEHYGSYIERDKRKGFGKELINKKRLDEEDAPHYIKKKDENLIGQFENFGRRLLYDQFKQPQGTKTRILQVLQSITSTQYMTINVHGGVANVTVGESNIIAEAFAKSFFGVKDYINGKGIWMGALPDFLAHLWDDKASTKAGAVAKFMQIIDFTEITGQVRELSPKELSKRFRDIMFSTLSSGEHFMQVSALFSMMLSHRVVVDTEGNISIMNLDEYIGDAAYDALLEMLTDEELEDFNNFITEKKRDANVAKDYSNFRRNIVSDFVVAKLHNRIDEFIKRRKELEKQREEDFNKYTTLWDNVDLGDNGKMVYTKDSILYNLDKQTFDKEVSDSDTLLGKFKNKVISVNGMIHGWYDKYNAAQIENTWWGGIVMQYHKHILPGILKRYRTHGYFNEFRDEVDKGILSSVIDFIRLDLDLVEKNRDINNHQKTLLQGLQNMVTYGFKFLLNAKHALQLLPEYDRANIKRTVGDISGLFIAVNTAIIANMAGGADDDDFLPNFVLYQADRLATEIGMWNPFGAVGEARKLWSSPIAAQSIITDALNIIGTTTHMLFDEDFDPYYHSGKYAGQHKAWVYTQRRIPYYRNIMTLKDMPKNNKYYKLGDNIFSLIPVKNIAEGLKDFEF